MTSTVAPASWMQRLRQRVVALSTTPHALAALCAVAFVDGSFFPIPPFALLIPMVLSRPERAWRYAILGTLASLAGGLGGYAIGYAVNHGMTTALAVDPSLPIKFHLGAWAVDTTLRDVLTNHFWLLAVACSVLPTPYKVVAIGSGIVGVALPSFVLASVIGRSARFFAVTFVLVFMRERSLKWFKPRR